MWLPAHVEAGIFKSTAGCGLLVVVHGDITGVVQGFY